MQLTPQQSAILAHTASSNDSLLIEAVAGSGKTSTLVALVNTIPTTTSILCCAFNKKIATELSQRMPPHVTCRTMNAIGHGSWLRAIAPTKLTLDSNKTMLLIREYQKHGEFIPFGTHKLVALAKHQGILPIGGTSCLQTHSTNLLPDTDSTWFDLIDHYDLNLDKYEDAAISWARRLLINSISRAHKGLIDFDDQLYMPTLYDAPIDKYDLVLVDEAQDISPIQRAMLHKLLSPNGRLIAAGDSAQAIYGFRGADSASMASIATEFATTPMPLSVSFRCPQAVVAEARRWVSHIEPHPSAPQGSVTTILKVTPSLFGQNDAIICRNNKPLIAMAYWLIKHKIPCHVLGRDIGQGLTSLIKQLKCSDMDTLSQRLEEYRAREVSRALNRNKESKAEAINDRVDTIFIIIENLSPQEYEVANLLSQIDKLFTDAHNGQIILSTIHKCKGLEWPRVYWLDADLLPSKWARQPWQLQQEHNLSYVCATRAKSQLIYISSANLQDPTPQPDAPRPDALKEVSEAHSECGGEAHEVPTNTCPTCGALPGHCAHTF